MAVEWDNHDLQAILEDHNGRSGHFGVMEAPDCHALGYNPVCGDRYDVYVRMDDSGIVSDVMFHGFGCVISRASASIMAESLPGQTREAACRHINAVVAVLEGHPDSRQTMHPDLVALTGVRKYPLRMKCVLLAWNAARTALTSGG